MGEISEEELSKKYKHLIGIKSEGRKFEVKGEHMVNYARAITDDNEKYTKVGKTSDGKLDYSEIIAHPAYPATFVLGSIPLNKVKHKNGDPVIKQFFLLLHTGIEYDYTSCIPIKAGDNLTSVGKLSNIFIKSHMLWIEMTVETKNEKGELVVKSKLTFGIQPGGY
ncbi:MAG: FAS1-like dehydratase domain-containing protein [Promethearchaeota archaeon]